jgi:hypothetical protein
METVVMMRNITFYLAKIENQERSLGFGEMTGVFHDTNVCRICMIIAKM